MPTVADVQEAFGLELAGDAPVLVHRVARGGLAGMQGLRMNDVLESVNGVDVREAAHDFVYALLQVRLRNIGGGSVCRAVAAS